MEQEESVVSSVLRLHPDLVVQMHVGIAEAPADAGAGAIPGR
jgi:hypothetical protein